MGTRSNFFHGCQYCRSSPCQSQCEPDAASHQCYQCCFDQTHEVPWNCGLIQPSITPSLSPSIDYPSATPSIAEGQTNIYAVQGQTNISYPAQGQGVIYPAQGVIHPAQGVIHPAQGEAIIYGVQGETNISYPAQGETTQPSDT